MGVEGGHIPLQPLKFFLPRYNFFLCPLSITGMPSSWQFLRKNSHDYALIPAMKSKDFKEIKGF
jgi:hypothetical protein